MYIIQLFNSALVRCNVYRTGLVNIYSFSDEESVLFLRCLSIIFLLTTCKYVQNSKLCRAIYFLLSQHFATKLCNFTNFKMFFSAFVRYLFILPGQNLSIMGIVY